jgi:hypothetical protein
VNHRRTTSLLAALVVVLAAACAYAVTLITEASAAAQLATAEARESRAQIAGIVSARDKRLPVSDAGGGAPTPEITRRIHEAAGGAGIPDGSPNQGVVRIDPAAPQRLPGTEVSEIDVPVRLQRVEVGQVVRFLYMLCENDPSLGVKSISFVAPGAEDQSPVWDVDVTLTWRARG